MEEGVSFTPQFVSSFKRRRYARPALYAGGQSGAGSRRLRTYPYKGDRCMIAHVLIDPEWVILVECGVRGRCGARRLCIVCLSVNSEQRKRGVAITVGD